MLIIKKDNHSKLYRYYVDNEKKIKDYCMNNNNINKMEIGKENSNNSTIGNKLVIDNFDNSQVKIGKVHLLKPDNMSVRKFEDYITQVLYINYHDLDYYQQMANYINETYYEDYPDFRIWYRPTFTWNKGNKAITGIGLRATNAMVSAKNGEIVDNKEFHWIYKKEVRDFHGLNLEKDVKSSVPRVSILMSKGEWVDESIDIYTKVIDVIKNGPNSYYCDGGTPGQLRDAIKLLHLRAYFDNRSTLGRNTCHAMGTFENKDVVYEAMCTLRDAIEEVEGEPLGSEIFYHESNIYLEVTKRLLDEGYFVWQVYDCWYARKAGTTQKEFENYVSSIVKDIAIKYIEVK